MLFQKRIKDKFNYYSGLFQSDKSYFLIALFFAIFPIIFSSFIIIFFQNWLNTLDHNILGLLIVALLASITMAFGLTPTTFVAILCGYYFGFFGLIGLLIAYPIAAYIGLKFGQWLNTIISGSTFFHHPHLNLLANKIGPEQFKLIFFMRLSPALPFAASNFALSKVPITIWIYLTASFAGMLPRTIVFFIAGLHGDELMNAFKNPENITQQQVLMALLFIISIAGLIYTMRRITKN